MPTLKNDKYERFCQEYLITLSVTEAAISAGYNKNTATSKGSQLLAIASIAERVVELKAERTKRVEIKADDIARQLDIMRRANISEYIDIVTEEVTSISENGIERTAPQQVVKFKDFSELTEDQLSCIESVKQGKQGIEMKLHGKDWTTEKLNRHIGFYKEDNEQGNKVILTNQDRMDRLEELKSKLGE